MLLDNILTVSRLQRFKNIPLLLQIVQLANLCLLNRALNVLFSHLPLLFTTILIPKLINNIPLLLSFQLINILLNVIDLSLGRLEGITDL